jgi:hypothetical protein
VPSVGNRRLNRARTAPYLHGAAVLYNYNYLLNNI